MSNSSNCNIVRDLLPLYLDGETSKETAEMVESHIAECDECRHYFRNYNRIPISLQETGAHGKYHYSKIARRIRRRNTLNMSVVCAVFLLLGYIIGHTLFPDKK